MSGIVVAEAKRALYFGYGSGGHFLRIPDGRSTLDPSEVPGFPWTIGLLDTGLLKNRKVPDVYDGRVHWTGGGTPFWLAFFWWDRSGDSRGASNSGFYVQGFDHTHAQEAFDYACSRWPDVVKRQRHRLVLAHLPQQAAVQMVDDYQVTVCAECLTASCWHGEFMCQKSQHADVTTRLASELRALGREHPDNFSREKLREVTGCEPPPVGGSR